MSSQKSFLDVAITAAKEAGAFLLTGFHKNHYPIYKSKNDVGLEVDNESERIILKHIHNSFPEHNIYSEETGSIENSSVFKWYIDPLDGTNNYFVGIPYFGVSVGLMKNGEPILGVVYNPITDQLFSAAKNSGAYLNGKKFMALNIDSSIYSAASFIKGHSNSNIENEKASQLQSELPKIFSRTLTMWAPSLDWCQLALGKLNALISFESELEDMLAGLLIAKEAGINVFGFDGNEVDLTVNRIAAAQNNIKSDLCDLLEPFSR